MKKDHACCWPLWPRGLGNPSQWNCLETIGAGAVPQAWKGSAITKYTIESSYCSTFGMDVHARTTTVKGDDRSTGATATKRFDDVPAPSEIASWMQSKFTGPWYAAHESSLHRIPPMQGAEGARHRLRRDRDQQHRALGRRQEAQERQARRDAPALRTDLDRADLQRSVNARRRDRGGSRPHSCQVRRQGSSQVFEEPGTGILLRHGHVWNEKTARGT